MMWPLIQLEEAAGEQERRIFVSDVKEACETSPLESLGNSLEQELTGFS